MLGYLGSLGNRLGRILAQEQKQTKTTKLTGQSSRVHYPCRGLHLRAEYPRVHRWVPRPVDGLQTKRKQITQTDRKRETYHPAV